MPIWKVFVSLFFGFLVSGIAFADVEVTRGSLVVRLTDISNTGGLEPTIERTYSSDSASKGIFGTGWGSKYEVYLTETGYGPVVIHDHGSDEGDYLFPEKWTASRTADLIVEAAQKSGNSTTPDEANKLRQKLLKDLDFLDQQWKKYAAKRLLTRVDFAPGAKVSTSMYGYKEITRLPDGYSLRIDTDHLQTFNEKGRLKRIEEPNGNFIDFTFDNNGNHSLIKDNFGRQMALTYNEKQLVTKIVAGGGKLAERTVIFKYGPSGALILSIGADGKETKYVYEGAQMSRLLLSGKTTAEVDYYGVENKQRVKNFRAGDGTVTSYSYPPVPTDVDKLIVVAVSTKNIKSVSKNRSEYSHKSKITAERWTAKKTQTVDGITTDTEYDENCGCPLVIKTAKGTTKFEYDEKGRVRKKETPTETIARTIDVNVGRVSYVERYPPGQETKKVWAKFEYDSKGSLISAEDSSGKYVSITRDPFGRVSEIWKSTKDQIKSAYKDRVKFAYDSDSRPTEIEVGDLGTLKVTYDKRGEIEHTDFAPIKNSADAARQIIATLEELTAITALAKAELSF